MNSTPAEIVENHLREQRNTNQSQNIWPRNNAVIDKLLKDGANLRDTWKELLELCPLDHCAFDRDYEKWRIVLDTIIDAAAGWSPEKIKKTRQALKDVSDLTTEIQDKAHELSVLLRRRTQVCEENNLSKTPMDFHPVDLLEPAARIANRDDVTSCLFMGRVDEPLRALCDKFDLNYWPRTADLVEALAEMQDDADFSGGYRTDAALSVRQASTRDFMRVLDSALSDLVRDKIDVSFSHAAYAALINAACGLDQIESAETVKKYRSDERQRNK